MKKKILLITSLLSQVFSKRELDAGMKKYILNFIKTSEELLNREGITKEFPHINVQSYNKSELSLLSAIPFSTPALFQAYRKYLPANVVKILDCIVWEKTISIEDAQILFNINIKDESFQKKTYYHRDEVFLAAKPEYRFFKVIPIYKASFLEMESFYLTLPTDILKILSEYYPKPAFCDFQPLNDAPPAKFYFLTGEKDIFLELPRMLAYNQQDQIKTSGKNRPIFTTISKFQKQVNLAEFFPDSEDKMVRLLRSNMLAGLIVNTKKRPLDQVAPFIKDILFKSIFLGNSFPSGSSILHYLKGVGNLYNHDFFHVEEDIHLILKKMPVNQWISAENIHKYTKYNYIELTPVHPIAAQQHLYYELKQKDALYNQRIYINSGNYRFFITNPYLNGVFFFLASFGLFDLAYDEVDIEKSSSPYGGLKGVRLTDLGAFVLEKQATYTPPVVHEGITFKLSEESLSILINKPSTTADILMKPFTQKVGQMRYKTDFSIFLDGCQSLGMLENKIALFEQAVNMDLPANWKIFFKELRQKIDPLKPLTNIVVFKIPEDNPALITNIAKDELLKPLIIKAEQYHIIVQKQNLELIKNRLMALGYLVTHKF